MLTARMEADFSSFVSAVEKAQISLRSFETGANKVGSALNRMADSFSGRKVIQDATLAAAAVEKIGGASKLTASEQARVSATVSEALAKYKALGQDAPAALQKIHADLTKQTIGFREMATAVGVVSGVVAGMAAGVAALGSRGAGVNDISDSFKGLTAAMGESADTMLGKLRAATLNNVTDAELMKTANLGLSQGLQLTAAQFGTVGDVAAVLADRIGGDVGTAFATLTQAMATGQDRTLKTIGLNIDATAATEQYAASIGKAVTDLTEQERTEAIRNAIMVESQKILAASGKSQADFGDTVAGSSTKLQNFIDGVSTWVATSPQIGAWASGITAASSTVTALGLALGPMSTGLSKLIPLLGLSGVGGAFATMAATITATVIPALGSALALLSPFLLPLAAVAAAVGGVYLAWQHWDKIGPIVERTYTVVKEFVLDKFTTVIDGVRLGLDTIGGYWRTAKDTITGIAEGLYTGVTEWVLSKPLALFASVATALGGLATSWLTAATTVTGYARALYDGVKVWMLDKFAEVVAGIKAKIDAVVGFFGDMYDKVVGRSIVPDLIAGIQAEFNRLHDVMVNPAAAAARAVESIFGTMGQWVSGKIQGMLAGMDGAMGDFLRRAVPSFLNQFSGQITSGLTKVLGSSMGGALASGLGIGTAAAGASAAAGGAAAAGGLGASLASGALTAGIGAAVGLGVLGIQKWMGQREHMRVNDLRDAWFEARGGLQGVNEASQAATGNFTLTQDIFGAKTRDAFARAVENWERTTRRGSPGFAVGTGGRYLDFGSGTPALLHGKERIMTEREGRAESGGWNTVDARLAAMQDAQERRDRTLPYRLAQAWKDALAH